MNKISKFIGQVLIVAFAAIIICYTSALTFVLAARIVPDNIMLQAVTVVLFDGAAFVWFTLFLTRANSVAQWGVAGLSWLVSMVGVFIMAGGELALSQSLFVVDDPQALGFVLVIAVIAAAIYNAAMVYIFHLVDGDTWQAIENKVAVATAMSEAYKKARLDIESGQDERIEQMAAQLKHAVILEAQAQLESKAAGHRRAAQDARTVDAHFIGSIQPVRTYPADTVMVPPPPEAPAEPDMPVNFTNPRKSRK